jgi:pyruvate dehydrogenase E1 component alpha subunit
VSNIRQVPEILEKIKSPENDPITRFEVKLRAEGVLTDAIEKACKDRAQEMLQSALTFAQNSPLPNPSDGMDDVYSQPV